MLNGKSQLNFNLLFRSESKAVRAFYNSIQIDKSDILVWYNAGCRTKEGFVCETNTVDILTQMTQ